MVSGLARQDNFVPSRRFREDGLEDLKLSFGALAVAKQNKSHFGGHVARLMLQAHFCLPDFHGQNTARGARVSLGFK